MSVSRFASQVQKRAVELCNERHPDQWRGIVAKRHLDPAANRPCNECLAAARKELMEKRGELSLPLGS